MFRYALLAVAFLALTQAKSDKCPFAIGKYPFDEAKYAGQWYCVAELPTKEDTQGEQSCLRMNYKLLGAGSLSRLQAEGSFVFNNKSTAFEGLAQASAPEMPASYNAVWKVAGDTKFSGEYKQTIIATDYKSFALYIACRPEFDETTKTFERSYYALILSRKTTLAEETLRTLMNVLSGYDIDVTKIKMMDHTRC